MFLNIGFEVHIQEADTRTNEKWGICLAGFGASIATYLQRKRQ